VTPAPAPNAVARLAALLPLLAGLLVLAASFVFGGSADLLEALVTPPAIVRSALVGVMVVLGLWLVRRAVLGLSVSARGPDPDVRGTLRGIRLAFLGLAAFAAAAGWLLGHPLPLVIAAVIAAVDVIETSFLLLLVGRTAR